MITEDFLSGLEYAWGAEIRLYNGIIIPIWYTSFPMRKGKSIKEIISVSSDYPKRKIGRENFIVK